MDHHSSGQSGQADSKTASSKWQCLCDVLDLDHLSLRGQWVALGVVLAYALIIRLVNLGSFPHHAMCDEADNAQNAIQILNGVFEEGFFGFDWKPQPALSVYLIAVSFKLFGVSIWALRLPSALISVLAIIPFFFLAKRAASVSSALASSAIFASLPWVLNFSRTGWENIHIGLYAVGAFYFLVMAMERRRWAWHFAAAGFFLALSLYGYFAGRVVPIAAALYLPFLMAQHRRQWKRVLSGYGIAFGLMILLFLPASVHILRHWNIFQRRSQVVYVFSEPATPSGPQSKVEILKTQWNNNWRAFHAGQPNNKPRYAPVGKPLLDHATGMLLVLGLFVSLYRPLRTSHWWLLLLSPFVFTQLLTRGSPDPARGIAMAPGLAFFVAAGLDVLKPYGFGFRQKRVPVVLMLLTLGICGYNLHLYVRWQQEPKTIAARGPYIESEDFQEWVEEITLRHDSGNVAFFNVRQWEQLLRNRIEERKRLETISPGEGGLRLRVYGNNQWRGRPYRETLQYPLEIPEILTHGNFSLWWDGRILIEEPGTYTFTTTSDDGSFLFINGEQVVDNGGHHARQEVSGRIELQPGWHDIDVKYFQDDGAYLMEVYWRPPGERREPLPQRLLRPSSASQPD